MTKLTHENYYQDTAYMSTSRFKSYMDCEAKQLAIDNGLFEEVKNEKPLIIGNYIHTAFESEEAHASFVEDNQESILMKSKKDKLADFKLADKVIANLKEDSHFMELYNGYADDKVEKELIVTGNLGGISFKGKLDSVNHTQGYFVDLKTMKSVYGKEWSTELGCYTTNLLANIFDYGYLLQMYVYHELLKQQEIAVYTPHIYAVSKQEIPEKEFIKIDKKALEMGKTIFNGNIERIEKVISGKLPPKHCGTCDYCKSHKIMRVKTISELLEKQ